VLGKRIVLVRASGVLRRVFESVQFGEVVTVADEWAPFDYGEGSSRYREGSSGPDVTGGDR